MATLNSGPTLGSGANPAGGFAPKAKTPRLTPILLGGAGVILLGGGGILAGLNSKLTSLQTSAQQKDAEVSANQQIAKRFQTTQDNYSDTQAHLKYLETSVSDRSYVPTLLAQVQTLAAQTHLAVSAVRPTPSPPAPAAAPAPAASAEGGSGGVASAAKKAAPPPYDTLDVAVDVAGTYADTCTFLYSLTRFPKIVSVSGVQMHPGTPLPGGKTLVTTNLKMTAFMFHDADSAAAPAAPAMLTPALTPLGAAAPPPAAGTPMGAAGRAALGAAGATKAADTRSADTLKTL